MMCVLDGNAPQTCTSANPSGPRSRIAASRFPLYVTMSGSLIPSASYCPSILPSAHRGRVPLAQPVSFILLSLLNGYLVSPFIPCGWETHLPVVWLVVNRWYCGGRLIFSFCSLRRHAEEFGYAFAREVQGCMSVCKSATIVETLGVSTPHRPPIPLPANPPSIYHARKGHQRPGLRR